VTRAVRQKPDELVPLTPAIVAVFPAKLVTRAATPADDSIAAIAGELAATTTRTAVVTLALVDGGAAAFGNPKRSTRPGLSLQRELATEAVASLPIECVTGVVDGATLLERSRRAPVWRQMHAEAHRWPPLRSGHSWHPRHRARHSWCVASQATNCSIHMHRADSPQCRHDIPVLTTCAPPEHLG